MAGPRRVAVVGAGVAGLVAARALRDAACAVRVFDKKRSPAGRISTRRAPGSSFDHGAQYFTVKDERFGAAVRGWRDAGAALPWGGRFGRLAAGEVAAVRTERERWVGTPAMSAVAQHLASGLEVASGVRVTGLESQADGWALRTGDGALHAGFDCVLVTAPGPQAAALLGASPELARAAAGARLRPCWAVMLGFGEPVALDWDGLFVEGSPLSWVARDSSKPGRPPGERWVLHAGPEWSEERLESSGEEVARLLSAAFGESLGLTLPPPVHAAAHRWRHALPDPALDEPCLFDAQRGLGAAGDWCGGPRVEGAFLSGRALARRVLGSGGDAPLSDR